MTTPSARPSARPPSSAASRRRFESLDSEAARRFVSGALSGEAGEGEAATPPPAPQGTAMPPGGGDASPPAAPPPFAAAPGPPHPGPAPARREPMKVLTVRLPESLHARLDYIARNSPHSMNSFVQAALEPAVAAELDKIGRRKAMGLD